MMIAPHQGQELTLMLNGKKMLAAFGDIIPQSGFISEEIIPEQAFAPHIQKSTLLRFEKTVPYDANTYMLYVCFTIPNEEWRAQSYIWLREQIHSKVFKYEDAHDRIFGHLLGYSSEDIEHFYTISIGKNLLIGTIRVIIFIS